MCQTYPYKDIPNVNINKEKQFVKLMTDWIKTNDAGHRIVLLINLIYLKKNIFIF